MPKLDINGFVEAREARAKALDELMASESVLESEITYEVIDEPRPTRTDPDKDYIPVVFKQFGDFTRYPSQGSVIEALGKHVPLNEYNFPVFLYRPDFLAYARVKNLLADKTSDRKWVGQQLEDLLRSSIMDIKYDEGFPTDERGIPVWEKFDFESREEYLMFLEYLNLGGSRAIHKIIAWPIEIVTETSKVNYWGLRVQAFDIYRVAYHERRRLSRILDTDDKHYEMATKYIDKIGQYIDGATEEDWKELGIGGAISAMEKLAKMQRAALGMTNTTTTEALQTPSMQRIMQTLTRGEVVRKEPDSFELLTDLSSLDMAQELILKVQEAKNVSSKPVQKAPEDG